MLIAEQGALGTSYGGWLADEIQRRYFDWLDQPIRGSPAVRRRPASARCSSGQRSRRIDEVTTKLNEIVGN